MSSTDPQDEQILIRCPSCGAKFDVEDSMRGRVVECGECEERFEILDSVIIRSKKFYPGEKKDPFFEQVAKIEKPLPHVGDKHVPTEFASHSNPVYIEPISPQRILMGALAVFFVVVTALFLILGASRGAALDGVSTQNRMVLAGFVTVLSTSLLIYANSRIWLLMTLFGLMMGAGLVSLPLYFKGGSTKLGEGALELPDPSGGGGSLVPDELTINELKKQIRIEPLEKERAKLLDSGSTDTALGLWLRDLDSQNSLLIRDYVIRTTGASEESHFYPRTDRDFLMVVTGVKDDIDDLATIASSLGTIIAKHESLSVVEVQVNNERFKSVDIEQLTDRKGMKFYELNRNELNSIDLSRVSSAIIRLSDVEPTLFREDIVKRLMDLLASEWYEDKGEVCRALLVWSGEDRRVGQLAFQQAALLLDAQKEVPVEMVALCLEHKQMDILPLMHELWMDDPARWEPWFQVAGSQSEKIILLHFDETDGAARQSACRILGQIGSKDSLPLLRVTATTAQDTETRIVAESSIQLIEKRLESEGE